MSNTQAAEVRHNAPDGVFTDTSFQVLYDRIASLESGGIDSDAIVVELERLGLAATKGEIPIWNSWSKLEWFLLLRDIARCAPRFGFKLAELRAANVVGEGGASGHARSADLPLSDLAALMSGCLWKAWETTVEHAESRPMFRRNLADFPAIRLRLLTALVNVLRVDEWAMLLASAPSSRVSMRACSALRRLADTVRIETQQICGGTGFMRESKYARVLQVLRSCDDLLRRQAMSKAKHFRPLDKKIEDAVAARISSHDLGLQDVFCLR